MPDYLTCYAVILLTTDEQSTKNESYDFDCAFHECSCSMRASERASEQLSLCDKKSYPSDRECRKNALSTMTTSTVVLNGTSWELSPPLDVHFRVSFSDTRRDQSNINQRCLNVSDCWFGYDLNLTETEYMQKQRISAFSHNGTGFNDTTIRETGRCVAEDAYSWGFSSLLLLTFCIYTICFAFALILLQTDVYWNSKYDRVHRSHSIYTDVLYLADELRAEFGSTMQGHAQSPTKVERMVEHAKHGLNIDVTGLPLSRWQEWRLSRQPRFSKPPSRGGILSKIMPLARRSGDSLGHKLRRLSSNGSTHLAQSDTQNRTLDSEASFSSRLEATDPRSSSDGNAPVHSVVGTPGSSMLEEQRLIASTTYEGT